MASVFGSLGRSLRVLLPVTARATSRQIVPARKAGDVTWSYRRQPVCTDKVTLFKAEIVMAFMWYWVLWHCYYDWGMIVGHYDYPDPSKWTDEELGIPPDEED